MVSWTEPCGKNFKTYYSVGKEIREDKLLNYFLNFSIAHLVSVLFNEQYIVIKQLMPQISNATKKHKDKITNSSRTKAARKEAQRQYEEINQEVRRDIRRDKRKFIDELSKEAETAAEKHSMKDLYDLTKKCI